MKINPNQIDRYFSIASDLVCEVEPEMFPALLCLVNINGLNQKSIDDFIYWWTGYNDLAQYLECEWRIDNDDII